jgi:predicted AAA+ superfamily ATPase
MVERQLTAFLKAQVEKFPVITLTGCRQSGKTTLCRELFQDKPYANLEDPELRLYAMEDPKGFLGDFPQGAVLDEIQRVPELFSYIQVICDKKKKNGLFVLTGSHNFSLMESISQSLAGRTLVSTLMPFSLAEIINAKLLEKENWSVEEAILNGGYPRVLAEGIQPDIWMPSYINTYLERDIRSLSNIQDLDLFQKFIGLCAGRIGQLVNYSSLAVEVGVNDKTIRQWINLLKTSYLVFELRPFHKNYGKRLTKNGKLYFCDTGVACNVLGIHQDEHLKFHPLKGALFENLIVLEYLKNRYNMGKAMDLFFWRDHSGHEIDILLGNEFSLEAVEIKSAKTVKGNMFNNLAWFSDIAGNAVQKKSIIYGGDSRQNRANGQVIPWKQMEL